MYQFTTETIVNSITDQNGKTKTLGSSAAQFNFFRAGTFKTSNSSVYKNPYVAPAKESINAAVLAGTYTAGTVYRLALDIKLSGLVTSDYANEYVVRAKQFFYEVTASASLHPVSGVATNTADGMAKTFQMLIAAETASNDFKYFTATYASSAKLTIACESEYQHIVKAQVQALDAGTSLTGYNAYTVVDDLLASAKAGTSSASFTVGTQGFGTVNWITKNLRLPTLDNTSWTAISADERPVAGGTYNQYTIRKTTDRGDLGGVSSVGQAITSVTTHIFYVLVGSVATAFESALTTAGFTLVASIPGAAAFTLNYADSTIAVGDSTSPIVKDAMGAVTYASGTTGVATVVAGTGVVTGVSAGTSLITATDALGSTATFTVTVIA